MTLTVKRKTESKESTIGELYIDGKFECYTLEDIGRPKKIWGKTRIQAGSYRIKFRKIGRFHNRYKVRFKSIYKGMLHILNIPLFQYVLIHCGNTAKHTAGCLLVGKSYTSDRLIDSTTAYKQMYVKVAAALERGEAVYINFDDTGIEKVG
ncbi:MAG: DUF5675 family protein [Spirochaetes bacterium]|jgi:hypothetical protein|nr:DUF5675 family protein [Spirochaetota bacterium]